MDTYLASLPELQQEAARFASSLAPAKDHAVLITLSGELGAGKTSFTQGIAKAFGIEEPVTSPTFVLEKIYDLAPGQPFSKLAHIDAYRLEGENTLKPLGFQDLYTDRRALIILEWPEMVAKELPPVDHQITLSVSGEGRTISYA